MQCWRERKARCAVTELDGVLQYETEDLFRIPPRRQGANKGSYGQVLIIAGSVGMSGAAYLSALAAYRTGAGLVRILTPEANRSILQIQLPEAIISSYHPEDITEKRDGWMKQLTELMEWSSVVVLGPGLGRAGYVKSLVEDVLQTTFVPLIVDADGLNTIAEYPYLTGFYTENFILTPHIREMSRLTGKSEEELLGDSLRAAAEYRDTYGVSCCLKSEHSVIAAVDGKLYRTVSGTPALAKAGSGDVLTGIIAGLYCLGMEESEAAAFGSFLHGLAGRRAAERCSAHGVLAREIADAVPEVMRAVPGISI